MAVEVSEEVAKVPKPQNEETRKVFKLSEGLLIAIISTGAYLLAFYYEKGYTSVFGIPEQFITISLVNVFIVATLAISFVLFIFPTLNFLSIYLTRIPEPFIPATLTLLCALLLAVGTLYFFGFSGWLFWIIPLIMIIFVGIMVFGIPLLIHRKKGAYAKRLEAQHEIDNSFISLTDYIVYYYGPSAILLILVFIISTSLAHIAGLAQGVRQSEFLVTNTSPEMAVLQIYGDNMICAPFDRKTKEVQKSFTIIKVTESSKLTLKLENIGPLKSVGVKVESISISTPTPTPTVMPSNTLNEVPSPEATPSPDHTPLPR